MKIGQLEKPAFTAFRKDFLALAGEIAGCQVNAGAVWQHIGSSECREQIIKEFIRSMEERYGFAIVLKSPLHDRPGSVEGVVGELYHVFSTMFLVEVINSKIRAGEKHVEV
ncbi:hypothetical protein [Desulforamulus hydrothermalis]|uniref:Uncharacterized protein n=1 Tax=Desulforamulus hydrothermalis Lam5 = DSM 18033 TaxID=1121428 RepID=K8EDY3_9FIRM|nr:hypothetical protein [Desulforamulus hydrothermalis]CCO07011.1 conserved hypothetical protein [Desulforamulus hydrothermalis Lam5 = DSM 18033]SHG97669.1 hypothetical protein SAMN02745177_00972 [Desulforamulus hydrothermalis Lam5 = DSM 18033]